MIRYGVNPIGWSNDDDQSLGAEITLDQCLREAALIGFAGIEIGHKFPAAPIALKGALEPHGLSIISGWHSLNLLARSVADEIRAITPHLDRLEAMGSDLCIVCDTTGSVHGDGARSMASRPVLTASQWPDFGARVEAVAEHCAVRGMILSYHHHCGTVVETPDEIDLLMTHTGPATRLLFDTGHCDAGGGDPAVVLRRHRHRLSHLHLKNVREPICRLVREQGLSFLDGVRRGLFTVPGDPEGAIDFHAIIEIVAATDYDGWLVIEAEQDPARRDPFTYHSLGLKTLKDLVEQIGLVVE